MKPGHMIVALRQASESGGASMKPGHVIVALRADEVVEDHRAAATAARERAVKEAVLVGAQLTGTWSMTTIGELYPRMVFYVFDIRWGIDGD